MNLGIAKSDLQKVYNALPKLELPKFGAKKGNTGTHTVEQIEMNTLGSQADVSSREAANKSLFFKNDVSNPKGSPKVRWTYSHLS